MPLTSGQVVSNRYRIIRLLGQGGFGAVYQAWDANLDRACALKENLETSGELSRQFEREARLLANLSHPNLPRVIDHFLIPQQGQYLVMDFIDGDDLEGRLLQNGRPLDVSQVMDWVSQVCDALTYLHRHDPPIIHRDIKPANIRITPQGRAVLVDFGIAKLYNPLMQTTVGARAVTPGYSPPEQYGRGATNASSDVYALGATTYTLLTGKTPADSIDLMTRNVAPLQPVHMLNPAVPYTVSQAISQAMNIEREARFPSIEAFRNALRSTPASPAVFASPQVVMKTVVASGAGAAMVPPAAGTSRVPSESPLPKVYPTSRPRAAPKTGPPVKTMAVIGVAGLFFMMAGLAAAVYILNLLARPDATPRATTAVAVIGSVVSPAESVVAAATDTVAPTDAPTDTPVPTDTPPPTPFGAVLAALPEARIAFVSDHGSDGKDQVFVRTIQGGEYLFLPTGGELFEVDPGYEKSLVGGTSAIPMAGDYNMAWWPGWCDGNRLVLYEAQDTNRPNFQTIYQAVYDSAGGGLAQAINWPEAAKIGVPRCANRSNRAIASGLDTTGGNHWRMHSFSLDNPSAPARIGDGFPFSGFASWAGDDSWIVFMHSENNAPFSLYWMSWDQPGTFHPVPISDQTNSPLYPSLSPVSDWLAYACVSASQWGVCVQKPDGQEFSVVRSQLAQIKSEKRGPKPAASAVTPSWSPDGRWLAYSSSKDGDWDIYLFNLELKVEVNLTQDLGGNQFQPAWSKP